MSEQEVSNSTFGCYPPGTCLIYVPYGAEHVYFSFSSVKLSLDMVIFSFPDKSYIFVFPRVPSRFLISFSYKQIHTHSCSEQEISNSTLDFIIMETRLVYFPQGTEHNLFC